MEEMFVARKCEILVGWPYTAGWCYNQYEYQTKDTLKAAMSFFSFWAWYDNTVGFILNLDIKAWYQCQLEKYTCLLPQSHNNYFFTKAYFHKKNYGAKYFGL